VNACIEWSSTDGAAVYSAKMCPIVLHHSAKKAKYGRKLSAYISDQPHIVRFSSGKMLHVRPRELVVMRTDLPHQSITKRPYTTTGLVIDTELFESYIPSSRDVVARKFGVAHGLQAILANLLDSCAELSSAGRFEQVGDQITRSFLDVLAVVANEKILEEAKEGRSTSLELRRSQVKSLIDLHFRDPDITVAAVAQRLGLSPRYVQLAFKCIEESPSDYLRQRRLEACARELVDRDGGHKSITTICFNNGFNSSSHFSSEFKRVYGMTPREWRASQQSEGPYGTVADLLPQ
jgi:AraC-like DNA-binding protein